MSKRSSADEALYQLCQLMVQLRDKEHGCPWDKEQTWSSIAPFTIEEAYEVLDAIEQDCPQALCAELGDLLFHVIYYCQIAAEADLFDINDVMSNLQQKILTRHPHVFANEHCATAQAVSGSWERIKEQERSAKYQGNASVLDDVALALPALMRAQKLQKRAALVGFDWPDTGPVFDKIFEEIAEVKQAIATGQQADILDECGDLLFVVTNLCRHLNIDAEMALRHANQKFDRRFRGVEQQAAEHQENLKQLSLIQLEHYWQQVKKNEE